MKKITFAVLTTATLLALSGCSLASDSADSDGSDGVAADDSPIKIGAVLPLSGTYTILGAPQKAALELEIEKVNAEGGIDGREVEIEFRDDTTDPTKSVELYNELAATGEYDVLISSSMAASSEAIGPSAIQYEIPTIALGPANSYRDGSNPWVFLSPATADLNAQASAEYLAEEGLDKIALTYISGDAYGLDGTDSMKKYAEELGLDIVFEEGYDRAATDFSPLIQKVLGTDADLLMVWGSGSGPSIIAGQWASLAADSGKQLVMTGSQGSNLFTYRDGEVVEATNGIVLASNAAVPAQQWPDSEYKDLVDDFAARWAELGDEQYQYPPQFAFEGAKAIQLIQAAIESAGSTDHEAVRDALEGLDLLTYTGQTAFSADDHLGVDSEWLAIVRIEDGDFIATDYSLENFESLLK